MRTLATVACATMALVGVGCGGRSAQPSRPEPRYAARDEAPEVPGARAADVSSRGSAKFGRFVREREPQLQFCYREARATSPGLIGSATVAVTLANDGRVLAADVVRRSWSGGDGSADVERCVLERVRGWRFPALDSKDERQVHSFAVIFST